ncbi:hypothetical protein DERF_007150 [Dermatophagoides farinae]|uniref:Uncharacterized protein n=1 Tax=Dermatophagoides farinae TaxID=6954 RepID=A0A922HXL1_DERFA|nr:putative uncharacterized protein DDB_G0287457 [Dermatophagoides farinae]KAH7646071.1 hypothetical protein HUG17_1609 [Dermatophagoides farinae]KAH9516411.1 hypothetical protein DERF_007150 [Dermatophagoides farinae]
MDRVSKRIKSNQKCNHSVNNSNKTVSTSNNKIIPKTQTIRNSKVSEETEHNHEKIVSIQLNSILTTDDHVIRPSNVDEKDKEKSNHSEKSDETSDSTTTTQFELSKGHSICPIISRYKIESISTIKPFSPLNDILNERIKNAFINGIDDDDDDDEDVDEEQDTIVVQPLIKALKNKQTQQTNVSSSPNINFKKWADAFNNDLQNCLPSADDSFQNSSFDRDQNFVNCSSNNVINSTNENERIDDNLSILEDKNPCPNETTIISDTSCNFSKQLSEKHLKITRNKPPVQSTPLPEIQRRALKRFSQLEIANHTITKPSFNDSLNDYFDNNGEDIEYRELIAEQESSQNKMDKFCDQSEQQNLLAEKITLRIPQSLLLNNNSYRSLTLEQIIAQLNTHTNDF